MSAELDTNRRNFLKWSGLVASSCASLAANPINAASNALKDEEYYGVNGCPVNCGSKCFLRPHIKNGVITHIETDNEGDDEYDKRQIRACVRGRSTKYRLYHKDRLLYPLKRVGKRGEGKFKRISWDEAFTTIADKLKEVKEKYGNEAIYIAYATGTTGGVLSRGTSGPWARLLGLYGGYLRYYNSYSTAQIAEGFTSFYGQNTGSDIKNLEYAKLGLFFGSNPVTTRMGGAGTGYSYQEMARKGGAKIIHIDPCYNDSMVGVCDEWIPIAPGTDAALIAGMAYVMIKENLLDREFLDKYCVGFSSNTLPDGAPKNGSYEDYVLGNGDDKTAKTPKWASQITKIPEERIIKLAREVSAAKPCYIEQGWGVQRHQNGEQSSRAIATLACMSGNVGILGGNCGGNAITSTTYMIETLPCPNPVKTAIPCFLWYEGIRNWDKMSDVEYGVRGASHLKAPIKVLFNTNGNCLTNQHADIQSTAKILEDDTLCELIIDVNITRTHSNSYADIILPDAMHLEQNDFLRPNAAYMSNRPYMLFNKKSVQPAGECMSVYDMCTQIALKLGGESFKEEFTQGRTQDQWLEYLWGKTREKLSDLNLPDFETFKEKGIIKFDTVKPKVAFKEFRDDPQNNPLKTPTGKIEIFSTRLYNMSKTWKLLPGQQINALPVFEDVLMGARDRLRKKYPLQFYGFHYKGRTHSSFWESAPIREINPQEIWINPIDADKRGIKTGDKIQAYNDIGTIEVTARVTARVMPGTALTYQGGWCKFKNGVDVGGCINTLTSMQPTAIAKGNGVHSVLVEIKKA
ncbi:DMSO/selenate family reductase complex A subunit [Campylobacter geochelonis]|uniref:Anaerobic dimethyl sulfoxide reductase chain A n=1 Tax=Campylobacter geochelonis TaxID=1780362 RepID=A0A128ECH3_9BACT|nr:DMSO/selenate family reductase complex A subunit [Campylobacter geochelonis]QKF72120.1 anaerobic DMSO reductase DmsABC, chain A [Campylobacter geochelonis]CZE46694.1 Anaerobic dimethyl sulfoxide reductase chain A [Campylobacter geochelonis]